MIRIFILACVLLVSAGCANMPLKEDGLHIGKDTTANIEDIGVGSVNSKF